MSRGELRRGYWRVRQRLRLVLIGSGGDRGKERSRRALVTTVTSILAQGVGLVVGLISVPLTLHYLGKERYGLWGTISALLTWAAIADFGLGRGLINHLSEAYAHDDRDAAGRYVSTALVSLSLIATGMWLVLLPLIYWIPWDQVLNVQSSALRSETRFTVAAVAGVFLVNFPLSIVGPVYAAYQRTYVANAFKVVGSLLSLGVLILATKAEANLPILVIATGGVPLLMSLVNLLYIAHDMPWLRPRLRRASTATLRALLAVSTPLLLFQIGSLLINELQTVIVARRSGLETVADYTVFLKVYTVPVMLLGMVDSPLLPAYREALMRLDVEWLRRTFWRVQRIKVAICALATVFYCLFGNFATALLSGHNVRFDTNVWIAASILMVVGTWNGSFNDLLVATNRLWTLVWFILGNGAVTATLTYFAAQKWGVFGIISATAVYSLLVTGWVFPILCWRNVSPGRTIEELTDAARGLGSGNSA